MELNTFGDGLQFGMELESELFSILENMVNADFPSEQHDRFLSFSIACKKRKVYLETLFKDNICSDMDTGVFQPIGSLDSSLYAIDTSNTQSEVKTNIIQDILTAVKKIAIYYNDFALKVKPQRNAIGLKLFKMAEETSHHVSIIMDFQFK
jgi:hypothetical protein